MKKKNPLQIEYIQYKDLQSRGGSWASYDFSVLVSENQHWGDLAINTMLGFRLCRTTKGNK